MEQLSLDFNPLPPIRLHQVFRTDTNHHYVFTCFQIGHGLININKTKFGYNVTICIYDRAGLMLSAEIYDMLTKYGAIGWAITRIKEEFK